MSTCTIQPPETNRGGRPSVRSAAMAKVICQAVSLGVPYRHAARAAGISYSAFAQWKKDDELFREQIEVAVASGIERRLKVIQESLESTDPAIRLRSACWFLEHVHPEAFSRTRVELTGADGEPLLGAVVFLPKKDAAVVTGEPVKEIENGHD